MNKNGGMVLPINQRTIIGDTPVIVMAINSITCHVMTDDGAMLSCAYNMPMMECPKEYSCDGRIFVPEDEYITHMQKRFTTTKE